MTEVESKGVMTTGFLLPDKFHPRPKAGYPEVLHLCEPNKDDAMHSFYSPLCIFMVVSMGAAGILQGVANQKAIY